VHSGTAPSSRGPLRSGMQLETLKTVLATVWISAVLIGGLTANLNSLSNWAVLASAAVFPPIVMMWRWNAPGETISQSIHAARR